MNKNVKHMFTVWPHALCPFQLTFGYNTPYNNSGRLISTSLSATFIFGARNFHPTRICTVSQN